MLTGTGGEDRSVTTFQLVHACKTRKRPSGDHSQLVFLAGGSPRFAALHEGELTVGQTGTSEQIKEKRSSGCPLSEKAVRQNLLYL